MPILNSLSAKNLNLPGSIAAIIHAAPMPGLADQPTCAITMDAIDKLDSSQLWPVCGCWRASWIGRMSLANPTLRPTDPSGMASCIAAKETFGMQTTGFVKSAATKS
jgi:hypothetical protein